MWVLDDASVNGALSSISTDQRKALLRELPSDATSYGIVGKLVGEDAEAYAELLSISELERYHMEPLAGNPSEGNWLTFAQVALGTGVSPKAVVEATQWGLYTHWGLESDHWTKQIQAFETIRSCDDERVREIAKLGIEMARRKREVALKEEREEDTFRRP
jgi:hypothetical protein